MRVTVSGLFLMTGDLAPLTRSELDDIRRLVATALVATGATRRSARVVLCDTIVPDGTRMIMCCIELQPSAGRPARVYGVGDDVGRAARTAAQLLASRATTPLAARHD